MKDIYECHKSFLIYQDSFEHLKNEPLTEADTRSKIIDKMFCEVLDWSEDNINREGYVHEGYYDYLFTLPTFRFIVEAKKTLINFNIPKKHNVVTLGTFSKQNQDVVAQVRSYLNEAGLQYAVITNGYQFIIGKFTNIDGTDWKNNKCLIFNGFEDIENRFVDFYNVLTKCSNTENLGFKIFLEETTQNKGHIILPTLPEKDSEIVRNSLSADLTPIIDKLFGELYSVNDEVNKELIKECFIENREIKKNKSEIDKLFGDTPPPVENIILARNTDSIVEQVVGEISNDAIRIQENPPLPIIIIGSKGAGKTTFINYLFRNQYADHDGMIKSHPYIYVDFREYAMTKGDFTDTLFSDILSQIYENYSALNLMSMTALKSIYHKEIRQYDQSIWEYDKINNPDKYNDKLNSYLETQIKDKESHFFKLSEHLIKGRQIRLCIVIDNADQFEIEIQKQVFLFAQSLNKKGKVTIIISLREGYYYKWKYQPPFDAYPSHVYHITAPPYKDVLLKRIDYALNQITLSGRTKGQVNDVIISVENDQVRKFLLSIKSSLFGSVTSEILHFIHETTYPNIREGLELFKQFLISGHTEVHNYILRYESNPESKHSIPYWEFIKAVGLNNKKYYNHNISLISNLFFPTDGSQNHFLKIKILKFLDDKLIVGGMSEKYVNVAELINLFEDAGYISRYTLKELSELCKLHLIETDKQLSDVEDASLNDVTDSICISLKGHHYVNTLINDFAYIEMTLEDTPIYDIDSYQQIKTNFPLSNEHGKRDLQKRVEIVNTFISYLEAAEKLETIESEKFAKNIAKQIRYGVQKDIDRIERILQNR